VYRRRRYTPVAVYKPVTEATVANKKKDTDVQLTNGSGEVKKLTQDEWEARKDDLLAEGWKEMGEGDPKAKDE